MRGNPRSAKTVTVREVAEHANVSVGTVSRYLNGFSLRTANSESIERAIRELGYKENFIAKGMKTRRTMTIGVALPNLDTFHTSILSALDKTFSRHGYFLVLCDYEGDSRILTNKLTFLHDRYVDGLIVSALVGDSAILKTLRREGIPFVFFNDIWRGFEADTIVIDNENSSFRAVEYLIQMNHRRIGVINGPSKFSTAEERFSGYRRALAAHGIGMNERWISEADWGSTAAGYAAGKSLLEQADRPSALFIANYLLGVGVLRAISELGLRIPEDISVVSFDDSEMYQVYRPAITCVRQPIEQIGAAVAKLMLQRLSGDREDFPHTTVLPASLVIRDSVKIAAS